MALAISFRYMSLFVPMFVYLLHSFTVLFCFYLFVFQSQTNTSFLWSRDWPLDAMLTVVCYPHLFICLFLLFYSLLFTSNFLRKIMYSPLESWRSSRPVKFYIISCALSYLLAPFVLMPYSSKRKQVRKVIFFANWPFIWVWQLHWYQCNFEISWISRIPLCRMSASAQGLVWK